MTRRASLAMTLLLAAPVMAANSARAETKVVLKKVHLCCQGCVSAVARVLKAAGAEGTCDAASKTIAIVAADKAAAQKAVDALVAAGFHGQPDDADITIKDDSGVKPGKVKSLTLSGMHMCCNNCFDAMVTAIDKVEGVNKITKRPPPNLLEGKRPTSVLVNFVVTGDFDAVKLIQALNAAGFHARAR